MASPASVRWALLSIASEGMRNDGNRIVELSLLDLLSAPLTSFSVFRPPDLDWLRQLKALGCERLVCSGTTVLLAERNYLRAWVDAAHANDMRCAVVAGCFWNPRSDGLDPQISLETTISVRDPYSETVCQRAGRHFPLVGCPTLTVKRRPSLLPPGSHPLRAIVGLHRKARLLDVGWFTDLSRALSRPLTILVQEPSELPLAREISRNTDGEIVVLNGLTRLEHWVSLFQSASICVTGRLHQALPALALGVPAVLVLPDEDSHDSRFSLATHVGIAMTTQATHAEDIQGLASCGDRVRIAQLERSLQAFLSDLGILESARRELTDLDRLSRLFQEQLTALTKVLRDTDYGRQSL